MSETINQPPPYQASTQQYQFNSQPYQSTHNVQTSPQSYVPAQVYNIPPTAIPTYPAVQSVQQNEEWFKRTQRNKPQSNSAGAASLIFISGGMNMAWRLGFSGVSIIKNNSITEHIICSWFIGGIIGAFIGALACNRMPKKTIVSISSALVTICGILQVSQPESYNAILASRYLNGIAVGLVFPMTFVLLGEEVVKSLRGMNAASVDTMCFSCGIFIQILYYSSLSDVLQDSFDAFQMSGALNIIYGVVAFIVGHLFIIESPLLYLTRGDELMAIDSLRRLQQPFTITYETYELLEEHKRYLAVNNERTFVENAIYGIPALLKLCFYRSFMALGFSYYVNFAFTYSCLITTNTVMFPYVLYAIARWLGPIITIFTLDSKGRKSSMIFGFLVCTLLAFAAGVILNIKQNFLDIDYLSAVKYILIFYQFSASMSMASSSAFLCEAFPLAVKPYYVAIVFTVEMLVQIIIICSTLSLVFLGVAIVFMPETKCLSLRECLPKFRQTNNFHN